MPSKPAPIEYRGVDCPEDPGRRRIKRLCIAMLFLVAGIFAYCLVGVRVLQWWTGCRSLSGVHLTAVADVPFWVGTSALVFLVLLSIVMRWFGGWKHEWFTVLCASAVAWLCIAFAMIVVAGLTDF